MEIIKQSDNVLLDISKYHEQISKNKTPKSEIKQRPDGLDYVDEGYLRRELNKHFPIWSWTEGSVQFIGAEWAIVSGELIINDNGIIRKFYSVGAARIQFKKNMPHTPENVVDIDKNVASANTNAFKRAVNRLCNIADDVYKKLDPNLDQAVYDELEINIAKVKDEEKRKFWQKSLEAGKINEYNVEQFKEKLNRQLQEEL